MNSTHIVINVVVALISSSLTGGFLFFLFLKKCRAKQAKLIALELAAKEEIELSKNTFISMVSHELRTPLTSIIGSLKLLENQGNLTNEDVKKLLVLANRNAERLIWVINDILDVEKIQLGKLELNMEKIELLPPIRKTIEDLDSILKGKEIDLIKDSLQPGVFIYADYHRIAQVLMRMLVNAIKFSEKGGKVTVSMAISGENVRISVKDEGPGIDPEVQSKIFDKFSLAELGDSRIGGAGLSLSICKNIVEQMNGSLGVESKPNEGSTFYVEFPIFKEEIINGKSTT